MSLPRYPHYKYSGVEWLGEVPSDWNIKQVRHLVTDGNDGMKIGPFGSQLTSEMLDDAGEYKVYGQENVIASDFRRGSRYISNTKFSELSVYEIRPGDVLVTMMGTSGRCAKAPEDLAPGIMDSHLLRLRVRKTVQAEFLRLLIDEAAYVGIQANLLGKGSIMHGLNSGIVKELVIALPSLQEQDALLKFIGRETAKIDCLVEEQRRLIELLKEKRQAVISHAVTKGLNPDAPMKDSGIEWLGRVPDHWRVLKLGFVTADKCDGPFGSGLKSDHYTEEGVRVIRLQNIRSGLFDDTDSAFIDETYYREELSGHEVQEGDVLIAGLGDDRNTVGRACVAPLGIAPAMVKADCFRFRLFTSIAQSAFVAMQLSSGSTADAGILSTGSTRSRIPLSTMASRRVALPPAEEQSSIVQYIEREASNFDKLITEAARAIDLLQERRTALVSAAVTGKIDVRSLANEDAA